VGKDHRRGLTHCPRNHPYDAVNTYVSPGTGFRRCRQCERDRLKGRQERKREEPAAPLPTPLPDLTPPDALTRTVEAPMTGRIKTLEDLLAFHKVDLAIWEVERFVVNAYEQGAKDMEGEVTVTPLHQIKAWLRRKAGVKLIREVAEEMLAEIRQAASAHRKASPLLKYKAPDDVLFELAPMDAHLNKLAWGSETGHDNYDSRIAAERWAMNCTTLLTRAAPWKPARTAIVLGNDFFNVASGGKATVGGTPQDVDNRLGKMFRLGRSLITETVAQSLELSPVELVFVRGNHDGELVWLLGEVIEAWYKDHPHVTVRNEPTARKYLRWGSCLLGFTHGDKEKADKLPLIMATERAVDWSETSHREWHLGHLHKAMKWDDEFAGVRVRRLPSLCSPDAWHAENGYVGTIKATEGYLFSKADGYLGHLSHSVKAAA
jgi:hypothetical protein